MDDSGRKNTSGEKNCKKKKNSQMGWAVKVLLMSFFISILLSFLSNSVIYDLNIAYAFIVLFVFIALGIVFDVVGLAVATADEKPFHSMAARRMKVGNVAVSLIKNADKVSSFCNDVIGDISGVISGATGIAIAIKLSGDSLLGNLIITSAISALIVGGKALFKGVAIKNSRKIVEMAAGIICVFSFKKRNEKQQKEK